MGTNTENLVYIRRATVSRLGDNPETDPADQLLYPSFTGNDNCSGLSWVVEKGS